jgi:uncharacterized membrane protein HdeD (DUF308 family)
VPFSASRPEADSAAETPILLGKLSTMTTTQPPAVPHHHDALERTGIALRGILAIALGILALSHPAVATFLLVAFSVFAIIDGLIRIVMALRGFSQDPARWLRFLEGAVGVIIGVVALRVVHSLITLTWTIAEWAALIGIFSLVFTAVAWRRLHAAWLWALGGIVLLVFAGVLIWATFGGLQTTGYAIGFFGIVYGVVSLFIAIRRPGPKPLPS